MLRLPCIGTLVADQGGDVVIPALLRPFPDKFLACIVGGVGFKFGLNLVGVPVFEVEDNIGQNLDVIPAAAPTTIPEAGEAIGHQDISVDICAAHVGECIIAWPVHAAVSVTAGWY